MSDLAIKVRQNFAFLTAVVLFTVVYSPLQPRPSQGLQLGGVHPEQQRGVHAGAGLDGADRARSRRRTRPFGRRLDDDGRLFRELSLDRSARRHAACARFRRMAACARDPAGGRDGHRVRRRHLPPDRRHRRVHQRRGRRLRPHPADHRHARHRRGLHRHRALPAAAARRQSRATTSTGRSPIRSAISPRPSISSTTGRRPGSLPSPASPRLSSSWR